MENKKTKIISMIAIIALVLTVITATYAYFQAQTGEGSQTDVKITANTVDTLTFETGSAISLSLDQENFAQGTGNQIDTTFARAILSANNKTNIATEHYYLYLNIENNSFTYTQDENTPEILLSIKDDSNNEITSINGLTHTTVTDESGAGISGFDITTKVGLVTLLDNREITTTSSKIEEWSVTITYINYDADQSANAGMSFSAKLMIQKQKENYLISDVCTEGDNLAECLITLNENSNVSISKIYHHDTNLENGANDNSYRYAGPSNQVNNFVCFGTNTIRCMESLYRIVGVFEDHYHGVSNQKLVKLIKYDYANSDLLGTDGDYNTSSGVNETYKGNLNVIDTYYWNYKANMQNSTNVWSASLLNKTNLNTNFINNIGSVWAEKIQEVTWKVGGNTWKNIADAIPSIAYQNEIVLPKTSSASTETPYLAKIGLMYVTDYAYAASPNRWTTNLRIISGTDGELMLTENWMYMGMWEWTITQDIEKQNTVFWIYFPGNVGNNIVQRAIPARPTFFLKSTISYKSGTGTMNDPIRIN